MAEVTILADMRETKSGIIKQLEGLGATVKVVELEVGDYVLSGDLAVERKTAVDFVNSLIDGRIHNQVGKLRLNFLKPVFLIEGDVYATRSAIAREALDGALSYLVAIEGCSILYLKDTASAAGLLYRMATHAQNGLGYDVSFRRGKSAPGRGEALFCIEGVPGVGPTTSIKILNHFRSVHAFMTATEDQMRAIPGLGPKKVDRIFQAIRWQMPEGEEAKPGQSLFAD